MGIWDDLKGLANELNSSGVFSDIANAVKTAGADLLASKEEDFLLLKCYNEINEAAKQKGVSNFQGSEGIALMIKIFENNNVQNRSENSILKQYYDVLKELISKCEQAVAEERCGGSCFIDRSVCEECQALYRQAKEALGYINNPEAYKKKYALVGSGTEEKEPSCSLCGAPLDDKSDCCRWCGTRRSFFKPIQIKVNSYGEIPSAIEYASQAIYAFKEFGLQQSGEFIERMAYLNNEFTVRADWFQRNGMEEMLTNEFNSAQFLKQSLEETQAFTRDYMKAIRVPMSESDVYQAARKMDVPVEVYLRGWLEGRMNNWAAIQYQEYMEEKNRREIEAIRRSREIEAEHTAKIRQINQENWARQQNINSMRTPKYNGGSGGGGTSGRCCGGCALFNTNTAECSRDGSHRTATESCGWFTWK